MDDEVSSPKAKPPAAPPPLPAIDPNDPAAVWPAIFGILIGAGALTYVFYTAIDLKTSGKPSVPFVVAAPILVVILGALGSAIRRQSPRFWGAVSISTGMALAAVSVIAQAQYEHATRSDSEMRWIVFVGIGSAFLLVMKGFNLRAEAAAAAAAKQGGAASPGTVDVVAKVSAPPAKVAAPDDTAKQQKKATRAPAPPPNDEDQHENEGEDEGEDEDEDEDEDEGEGEGEGEAKKRQS